MQSYILGQRDQRGAPCLGCPSPGLYLHRSNLQMQNSSLRMLCNDDANSAKDHEFVTIDYVLRNKYIRCAH